MDAVFMGFAFCSLTGFGYLRTRLTADASGRMTNLRQYAARNMIESLRCGIFLHFLFFSRRPDRARALLHLGTRFWAQFHFALRGAQGASRLVPTRGRHAGRPFGRDRIYTLSPAYTALMSNETASMELDPKYYIRADFLLYYPAPRRLVPRSATPLSHDYRPS